MTPGRTLSSVKADLSDGVRDITARYPRNRSAIMPALYLAQERYGTVDDVVYRAVAEILDVPEIWVFEVASFYTLYNRQALGRFHIQICTNVSCMLLGAYDVLDHLKRRLGVEVGATTADGLFTISCVECIGACDGAPAMMVNETYHDNLTPERLDEILDGLEHSVQEAAP